MQTLTEYEYLDRDIILRGVVDWMIKESPMLKALPMKSMQGNSLKYNVSTVLPGTAWVQSGDQLVETTGTYVQRSADIYTMIQTAYTDKGAIKLNGTQNPETIDTELAAQAMAQEFERALVLGQTSTASNSKEFKGLFRLLAELESESTTDLDGPNNDQVLVASATSGAATMILMDELVDMVKPGKPDALVMSKKMRRKLTALQRASGGSTAAGLMLADENKFGIQMEAYNRIPMYIDEWMPDNIQDGSGSILTIASYDASVTRASGYDNTAIFAIQLGEDKVTGLHAGEMEHERETFVEDYNAIANRYVWYVGLAAFKKYSLAAMININPDS